MFFGNEPLALLPFCRWLYLYMGSMNKDCIRISIDVPKVAHKQLKTICVQHEVTIREVIVACIETFIDQNSSPDGK